MDEYSLVKKIPERYVIDKENGCGNTERENPRVFSSHFRTHVPGSQAAFLKLQT
jgi:hypothetical protein